MSHPRHRQRGWGEPVQLSVVMAVRDEQPYVKDAIESVLAQSFADFEFIIVDDGSTDETPAILRQYQRKDSRIRLLRNHAPLGPYPSANRALAVARGRFIARHDGDDISPPARFDIQLETLESDEGISLVTGAVESFGHEHPTRVKRPPSWQPRLEWELLFRNVVGAGAHVMFPRLVGGNAVLFPERYPYAEDYRLWCVLSRLGRVVCPEEVVYGHRQHPLSITCSRRADQAACFAAMCREYQSGYLGAEVDRDVSAALSRFWIAPADRPAAVSAQSLNATLSELRRRFLDYIQHRFGQDDRATLDAGINHTLRERSADNTPQTPGVSRAGVYRAATALLSKLRSGVRSMGPVPGAR